LKEVWFKSSPSGRGLARVAKPLTWQGWTVQAGAFLFLLLLVQAVARWAAIGFQPAGAGIWLAAGVFMLIGLYLKVVKHYSDTSRLDQAGPIRKEADDQPC
jgi:hypothetical protein